MKKIFFCILKDFGTYPDPHPDPLVRVTDPRIRIRIWIHIKTSRIRNTAFLHSRHYFRTHWPPMSATILICLSKLSILCMKEITVQKNKEQVVIKRLGTIQLFLCRTVQSTPFSHPFVLNVFNVGHPAKAETYAG
jgi:hypothetical protein